MINVTLMLGSQLMEIFGLANPNVLQNPARCESCTFPRCKTRTSKSQPASSCLSCRRSSSRKRLISCLCSFTPRKRQHAPKRRTQHEHRSFSRVAVHCFIHIPEGFPVGERLSSSACQNSCRSHQSARKAMDITRRKRAFKDRAVAGSMENMLMAPFCGTDSSSLIFALLTLLYLRTPESQHRIFLGHRPAKGGTSGIRPSSTKAACKCDALIP